jgi:hypothetical protein
MVPIEINWRKVKKKWRKIKGSIEESLRKIKEFFGKIEKNLRKNELIEIIERKIMVPIEINWRKIKESQIIGRKLVKIDILQIINICSRQRNLKVAIFMCTDVRTHGRSCSNTLLL